ncbi:TIGR02678 family protein [Streptomyces sp. W16]|uniref:TIGR02678 family protein n=1 Tax=Streptomyces sp. W16 TaxID=3076631 RepID=UPI00295BD146|nr:TIGR02678 family protein [Streptomyces sp. W16]MDV9169019.1 TIGR02678 family protein [Streptomyces sp. W16]
MTGDAEARRRAFTALLAHPVIDRRRHPELYALVRHPRHQPLLAEWFASRLGYRLVVTDSAARLFRPPLGTEVTAPRRFRAPSRRVLVLAILAAAAAEDAEDVTTTQDLSDRVRTLTNHDDVDVAPYDPDRFAERQLFVKAVGLLVDSGALRPVSRDAEQRGEGWAHRNDVMGGAYEIGRDLLLRLVDPAALRAALASGADGDDEATATETSARFAVMRRLIELPVCLWTDLTPAERAYLTGQRHRILSWCTEMTGWAAEQRVEGLALVVTDESETDLPFPRLRAVDFATLMVLDQLLSHQDADGLLDDGRLDRAVAEVRARYHKAMTKELQTDQAIRGHALELLRALDMLRPAAEPGRWILSPAAARFRDPKVVSVAVGFDEVGDR